MWVKNYLIKERLGCYNSLLMTDLLNYKAIWSNYMRIDFELLGELLIWLKHKFQKVYQVQVRRPMGANVWFCVINFLYTWKKEILLFYNCNVTEEILQECEEGFVHCFYFIILLFKRKH